MTQGTEHTGKDVSPSQALRAHGCTSCRSAPDGITYLGLGGTFRVFIHTPPG